MGVWLAAALVLSQLCGGAGGGVRPMWVRAHPC